MVTVLDLGLMKFFGPIFVFILVWVVSYAILNKVELLGGEKNKQLNSIIALCLAAITLFSTKATNLLTFLSPYFLVLIFFILMLLLIYEFLGVKESHLQRYMELEFGTIHYWVLSIALIIIIMALSNVFGPGIAGDIPLEGEIGIGQMPADTTVEEAALTRRVVDVIYHPKVLGLLLLLLVATFTINSLTRPVYDTEKQRKEYREYVLQKK